VTGVDPDAAKSAAAKAALDGYVRDGMRLGLGSGSTSLWFVRHLAEAVRGGLSVVGVPSSSGTRELALELGVPLADLDELGELGELDLTVDGADEIDPEGTMLKGGGGALLYEKIVADASRSMVAMVDESKLVDVLGAFPLPIEVVPFGWTSTQRRLAELFGPAAPRSVRRPGPRGTDPFITDGGHVILDVPLERIPDPRALAARLNLVPGVVEHGLFVDIADAVVVGRADGTTTVTSFAR
jgi:ribose 5-phosphate isomerase A